MRESFNKRMVASNNEGLVVLQVERDKRLRQYVWLIWFH